ncbi:transporter substrate-binding domain-containing protein [Evansella sp. LMS18]|jgi:cystine transport system substrate-binding protein|uniref:transporter substrate-binding domain-containing protein n=1 Tax=Evansella sp. LMS18 TaxID=2924033 RepID=UPI0020D1237E|nr:transporter substrate-binding domain-containing protein [Evansella sp. LMS18]UTR11977.1 transporter substrate-binding domain-containing protein [Evansella sp. LMS18]
MKKALSLLMVPAALTVLAACGGANDNNEEQAENTNAGNEANEEAVNNNNDGAADGEDSAWAEIEEEGTLIVGTSGTYAPVTFHNEDNELTGFDVELARAIADYHGLEVQFETMEFDGILPALRNGQIHMAVNDFAVTEERLETFDFTDPYKFSYGSVIVRSEDADQFQSAEDLEGVDAALGSLTSNYARFAEYIGANSTAYDGGVEPILRDILGGNQDAYLNDRLVLARTLEEFGDENLTVAEDVKYHSTESAIPVLKGNEELVEQLNEAIEALREDGTIAELSEEFYGEDASEPVDSSEVYEFDF